MMPLMDFTDGAMRPAGPLEMISENNYRELQSAMASHNDLAWLHLAGRDVAAFGFICTIGWCSLKNIHVGIIWVFLLLMYSKTIGFKK